jgi:hypothetical protein
VLQAVRALHAGGVSFASLFTAYDSLFERAERDGAAGTLV